MNFEIDNHKDALTLALQLAVTAPNDALAQECLDMAKEFASQMPRKDVDICLMAADVNLEMMKGGMS